MADVVECSDLSARTAAVTAACCSHADEDCTAGLPAGCSLACAGAFLPFFDGCLRTPSQRDPFASIAAMCRLWSSGGPSPACTDDPQCGSYAVTFDQAAAAGMGSCSSWTPQILAAVLDMLQPPLQAGVSIEQLCPESCLTPACRDPYPTGTAPPPLPPPVCPAGTYMGYNRCLPCIAGKYIDVAGGEQESDCIVCPLGQYLDSAGNDRLEDCIDCIAGKYIDVTGSDQGEDCIDCPTGRYLETSSNDDRADCIDCIAGKYIDVTGSDQEADCINCFVGQYVDVTGSDQREDCIDCPTGKSSPAGSSSVMDCINCTPQTGCLTSAATCCSLWQLLPGLESHTAELACTAARDGYYFNPPRWIGGVVIDVCTNTSCLGAFFHPNPSSFLLCDFAGTYSFPC